MHRSRRTTWAPKWIQRHLSVLIRGSSSRHPARVGGCYGVCTAGDDSTAAPAQYVYLSLREGSSYFFLKMSDFEMFLDQGQSAVNDLWINNEWAWSEKEIAPNNLDVCRIFRFVHKGHAMKDNDRHYMDKERTSLPQTVSSSVAIGPIH